VHVRSDGRGQVGMGGDPRGAAGAVCKIAGIAYTGSNPVPATTALTSNNAAVRHPIRSGSRVGFPSAFPPPDAPPTPPTHPAPLSGTRPRSAGQVWARSGELVDVDPLGDRAAVGMAQLCGDDGCWFLLSLWVPRIRAPHATWAYSWINPPR
jgi:hypothetical protein